MPVNMLLCTEGVCTYAHVLVYLNSEALLQVAAQGDLLLPGRTQYLRLGFIFVGGPLIYNRVFLGLVGSRE